jgi:hypothetical protein
VNQSITSLVDTAVAGTTNVSADSNVTLTTTTGASNQARQAILLFSGSRTAIRTVTAPAQSKIYTVINATTGGFAVQLVGAGPTTGVTIPNGGRTTVAWNGSDFVELTVFGSNIGVGATPSAITSGYKGIAIGGAGGTVVSNGVDTYLTANAASVSGSWQYTATGAAAMYNITGGQHIWNRATSGSSGNAITWIPAMNLTAAGNLGIGTTSPSSPLTVVGAIKAVSATQSTFYLSNAAQTSGFLVGRSIGSNDAQNFFVYDTVAAATRMFINESGDVLVGTTTASYGASGRGVVEVNGSSSAIVGLKTGGTTRGYMYTQGTDIIFSSEGGGCTLQTASANPITFATNSTERARFDASGNLLIGTTAYNEGGIVVYRGGSAASAIVFYNQSTGTAAGDGFYVGLGGAGATDAYVYNREAGNLIFGNGNTERARFDTGGALLVGTATSVTSARAVFNSSSGANIVVSSSILVNGNSTYFSARNIDTVQRQCDIGVYKHAGITNSVGYVAYVEEEGTQQYTWVGNDGNFRISVNAGDIGTNGGTVVGTQTSDERLKNIVGGLQYGLSQILALEPIAFAMKDSPNNKKIGFSAQQVQPIIPEAVYDTGECIDGYDADPEDKMVQTPKSGRTKLAMEYTQLVPVLVKAMQEQQAIISAQSAVLESLKARLDAANL